MPKVEIVVPLVLVAVFCGLQRKARAENDWIGFLQESMAIAAFDNGLRVQLSGLLDTEGYSLPETSPGLIFTDERNLINSRLSLFLDAQAGSQVYFFAQGRLDRGFDPNEANAEARLDEYALRWTPWDDGRLSVQAGQFGTVVGSWMPRHLSWDNPFVNAPLPYENLTAIWDDAPAGSARTLLAWGHVPTKYRSDFGNGFDDKHLRLPVIWGPSYASGISVAGQAGDFEFAAEVKNASLSSAPDTWQITSQGFGHPTFSGRAGYRPNPAWNFGVSGSSGTYLNSDAETTLRPGRELDDYRQIVLGADASYASGHLQIWSEVYASRFVVPGVGDADTLAYYLEAKYKFTPQLFGALRWNQQLFQDIPFEGTDTPWGRDIWRIDSALGYRFTPSIQLKLQHSIQSERWASSDYEHTLAGQFTVKF